MEVITSVREWKKGEFFRRHYQHGIDVAYVIQGSMIELSSQGRGASAPALESRNITGATVLLA